MDSVRETKIREILNGQSLHELKKTLVELKMEVEQAQELIKIMPEYQQNLRETQDFIVVVEKMIAEKSSE